MTSFLTRRRARRDTEQQRRVLTVLFLHDLLNVEPPPAYSLMKATGLWSGRLYPILARLEAAGRVGRDRQERGDGRPPRQLYRLTEQGRAYAVATVTRWLQGEEGR